MYTCVCVCVCVCVRQRVHRACVDVACAPPPHPMYLGGCCERVSLLSLLSLLSLGIVTQPCPSGMHGYSHVLSCAHVVLAVPNTHVKDDGKTTLSIEVRRLFSSDSCLSGHTARVGCQRVRRACACVASAPTSHPMHIDVH